VTLVALLLEPETQTVTVVNAGHPLPLVLRRTTGALEEAVPRKVLGPPIAVMENYPYEAYQVVLQPGDNLILYSDGVTDALDADGNAFGIAGLREVLERGSAPPRKLGERIIKAIAKHAAGCSQHDDITLVCFGRLT
jgi:sigma-B regulation protein RsbU (phosphoserine phosphatase)